MKMLKLLKEKQTIKNNPTNKPLENLAKSFANRSAPREGYCDLGLTDQSAES